jgi:splicing factor 3B subunit 1
MPLDAVGRKSGEIVPAMADGPQSEAAPLDERKAELRARRSEAQRAMGITEGPQFDPFDESTTRSGRTFSDVMTEVQLAREEAAVERNIARKERGELPLPAAASADAGAGAGAGALGERKRRRWDDEGGGAGVVKAENGAAKGGAANGTGSWAQGEGESTKPRSRRWDATPDATALGLSSSSSSSFSSSSATPQPHGKGLGWADTPSAAPPAKRSRWDETPLAPSGAGMLDATPVGNVGLATPMHPSAFASAGAASGEAINTSRWERELRERNRPWTDKELNELLPSEGYEILAPPANYKPVRFNKLMATPLPGTGAAGGGAGGGFFIPEEQKVELDLPPEVEDLPISKPEDVKHFGKLLEKVDESQLTLEEQKERQIMSLLVRIKNGTPPMRKTALRQLTDKAQWFGAGPLFKQILPLFMVETLEDQERHLLVKVIDRVLFKLDDKVRPYVRNILAAVMPMLIDEDYFARVEAREIISNLAKAAGRATMIATMRPDIDNEDEFVRNAAARAFAVVASALGIHQLMPFLAAVCQSTKSWYARHTGIKIVQQIAILMGNAVLPQLKKLVEIVQGGLKDAQPKVEMMTALALAALAEAAAPYGIESFDSVLRPLWEGVQQHRDKMLAAYLKAIGFLIPLMDPRYANYYTREVMPTLIREMGNSKDEMKKVVLKVVRQCVTTEGVEPGYVKAELMPPFFKNFWVRRTAGDAANYKLLVECTLEIANKVGGATVVSMIVDDLKDEHESYRRMVVEAIDAVITKLGCTDIDDALQRRLVDGCLHAFQVQLSEDNSVVINGVGSVINALGERAKPHMSEICGIIVFLLNNRSVTVRKQAADLLARIAPVLKTCGEESRMGQLAVVLYENLGEEYPEVLGSILGALKSIVSVIGMERMTPPIKDLLPRLTPILRNRHEKVQENCIDLIGRIADRGPEYVSAKEWMRICFELLELLKAIKKSIRRAAVNTFGYIAKAIGPHDVLATLLNNLKVQERQNRVCTTVAIAIVAETCSPFTVLPALMNEYRVRELNVQNGVLKALSFLFEYIGAMGKDYVYAVAPLLEDALMDRDAVHRQTASTVIKHMALGCVGQSREDVFLHLLNYVWPNIFEASPHVINAVLEAVEAMRLVLGPVRMLQYLLQGLFHPARKVRQVYWKVYNTLYMGAQDSLVAGYPRVPDDAENHYYRAELEIHL